MKKNLVIILSLLLGLLVNARASNLLFQSDINVTWNNFYNMKLPYDANVINTIYQDSNGLVWIGTKRGLVNYNGYNYHLCYYGKNMPDENTVQTIVQSNNFLYIGTDNGIRKLNLLTWKFESTNRELSKVKAVRALTVFDEKLWIGTRDEGLLYYDMQAKRLHKISSKIFQHKMVYALLPVNHKLFVGSYGGLNVYDAQTHKMISVSLSGLKDPIVNSLAYDKRNNCVWLGTDGKLMVCPLNGQQVTLVGDISGCYLKSIVPDIRNNRLLIGTETGMLLYKIPTKSFLKIEHDVQNAANILPKETSERGRITKGAALSLLGRIALYNEKWDAAIKAYEEVTTLGYSLFPDYTTLFTEDNESCDEIIWGVRYEGPGKGEGNALGGHWGAPLEAINGTIDLADAYYTLDGTPYPKKDDVCNIVDGTPDLWSVTGKRYENRDPRLKATLFLPGMTWGSADWNYGGSAASFSTVYVMKYFNPALTWSTSWDSGQDFYLIRYSEVLLSLAEAYIESNQNLDKAVSLIDEVRQRAGMPTVETVEGTGLSQDKLREIVRHERRVELAFEGLRLFDLYRWHTLKDAVDRINNEASTYKFAYEYRNYKGEQEYVWPIPQTELDSNPMLTQNDLWK